MYLFDPNVIAIYLCKFLDAEWYESQYPDVVNAGMSARNHYINYGYYEGRQPCKFRSLESEAQLWETSNPSLIRKELESMTTCYDINGALAAWILAKWNASFCRWREVSELMDIFNMQPLASKILGHQGPQLLHFKTATSLGRYYLANKLVSDSSWPNTADKKLAHSMLVEEEDKFEWFSSVWKDANVASDVKKYRENQPVTLDNIKVDCESEKLLVGSKERPLISVIMPIYNAEESVETAIRAVLQQSWSNLELIVVDDNSTDNTRKVVREWQGKDSRIKLICLAKNYGTYVSRNTGLENIKGEYFTCHDGDDWSHPQKLEAQALALINNSEAMASISCLVRCDKNFDFQRLRVDESWIHRNTSSLMFKRMVNLDIGFWDLVSVGADTEYLNRVKRYYGINAVIDVLPGVPLSFCRVHSNSLTQNSSTHIRTDFVGIRKDYQKLASGWHRSVAKEELYLPPFPSKRAFKVPQSISLNLKSLPIRKGV